MKTGEGNPQEENRFERDTWIPLQGSYLKPYGNHVFYNVSSRYASLKCKIQTKFELKAHEQIQ